MLERTLLVYLLWMLVCLPALGQETAALHDPMMPYSRTDSAAEPVPSYHLRGTLISPSGRVAMFNGKLAHEGDRVNGAQILAIDAGAAINPLAARLDVLHPEVEFHPPRPNQTAGNPLWRQILQPTRLRPKSSPTCRSVRTRATAPYGAVRLSQRLHNVTGTSSA